MLNNSDSCSLFPWKHRWSRAERVAAIAAEHAGSVDSEARFPHEAMAALKAEKLMGIMVPADLAAKGPASPKWWMSASVWAAPVPPPP